MSIPLKSRNHFNFSALSKCRFLFKQITSVYSCKQSLSLKILQISQENTVLESLFNSIAGRNFICERLLLFVSSQNTITKSSGESGLDQTSTECKVSIFFKMYRSSPADMFCKKGVLTNITKFVGKHLCHSLFLNKDAGLRRRCYRTPLVAASQRNNFIQ